MAIMWPSYDKKILSLHPCQHEVTNTVDIFDNKVSNLPKKVEINIKRSFWRHDSLIRFFSFGFTKSKIYNFKNISFIFSNFEFSQELFHLKSNKSTTVTLFRGLEIFICSKKSEFG